jgi:catalase (peroxidase I)
MPENHRWHSAGTYNKKAMNGGPFGSIRFPEELKYEANAGLEIAFKILQPLKETFPKLSYGDFLAVRVFVAAAAEHMKIYLIFESNENLHSCSHFET